MIVYNLFVIYITNFLIKFRTFLYIFLLPDENFCEINAVTVTSSEFMKTLHGHNSKKHADAHSEK